MKKCNKNNYYMQTIYILLLAAALIFSNFSVIASTDINTETQKIIINEFLNTQKNPINKGKGEELLLFENFTDGNIPPQGSQGTWTHIQTNQDETWYIDSTNPHGEPYCGTIHRGDSDELQDEWLITPTLDFSSYDEIRLEFYWYTEYYVSSHMDYIDLNISVSIDGGSNWTKIWSEDDVSGVFPTWEWIDSNDGNPIDLSDYAQESNVKIAFQYFSNRTEQSDYQEFSIDDIKIIGIGGAEIECTCGGPYEWWWPQQYDFENPGVRFHGDVDPWKIGYTWIWNFGDGNTSNTPLFPVHFFNEVKTYNVTLTIIDNSYNPPRYATDKTTVTLFLIKPPDIDIELQKISFLGVQGEMRNVCDYNATFVNWSITIDWGPRQIFTKLVGNDTIDRIAPKSTVDIQSRLYFFALGRIHINIEANPENYPGVIKHFEAFKIGPLILVPE